MNFFVFVLINLFGFAVSSSISLCDNVPSTWSDRSLLPSIVVLRENKSTDPRMTTAIEDAICWIRNNFEISQMHNLSTKGDDGLMCFKVATVLIEAGQLMVVVMEGSPTENCTTSLYGPIPNILNINMFVDVAKNDSTRRMQLSLRNTGGHFGVQFELHRSSVISKIQKTLAFMMQLSKKTREYSKLLPFWKPKIDVPPGDYHYRVVLEERNSLVQGNMSIDWLHIVSVMPMLIFGIVVSCYIVIHPRGGLTYIDEEVDFTIQEVDSNSKVNTVVVRSPVPFGPKDLGVPNALPNLEKKREPDMMTAIPEDDVKTDETVLSERKSKKKSTERLRMEIVQKPKSPDSTKTGKE